MKLISWNMHQRAENWAVLAELMREYDAVSAMVQEAVAPPPKIRDDLRVFPDPSLGDKPWRMPVPTGARRNFASAVAVLGEVPVEPWIPAAIGMAAYGEPAISHPGQWVAIGLGEPERRVWAVSLYGLWETMPDSKDIFAQATLHRALSDLALLLQARAISRVVVAGDLNIWRGYGHKDWEPGYRSVFERLGAYGVTLIGPHRTVDPPLEGCPCGAGADCSHVRTYRHQRRASGTPYQNDYAFVRGIDRATCVALDDERYWQHSDHCPLLIDLPGL